MYYYKNISHTKSLGLLLDVTARANNTPGGLLKLNDFCPTVDLAGLFNLHLREQCINQPYLPWIFMQ